MLKDQTAKQANSQKVSRFSEKNGRANRLKPLHKINVLNQPAYYKVHLAKPNHTKDWILAIVVILGLVYLYAVNQPRLQTYNDCYMLKYQNWSYPCKLGK